MPTPRFLRRNQVVRGLAHSDTAASTAGLYGPGPSSENLIMPQCIEWPFTTDDDGLGWPAGTVGIRSVSPGRAAEEAWATPGDLTEGLDEWIAVPDTLPSGYTLRRGRDVNRGPAGPTFDPGRPTFSDTTRGTPWLTVEKNGQGEGPTFASNYTLTANGFESYAGWRTNGQTPGTVTGFCPSYRPDGGGGIVPLGWVPTNVSKKTLRCYFYDSSRPPLADLDPSISVYPNHASGMWIWTTADVGFRAITMVGLVATTPFLWGSAANGDVGVQFIVKSNGDGSISGNGSATDYLSPVYHKSDFVFLQSGPFPGVDYYFIRKTITNTWNRTKADGLWAYKVGFVFASNNVFGSPPYGPVANAAGPGIGLDYQQSYRLHPRADIPAWFSTYGQGVGAPGGV
jgi:hypothetical protein